MQPSGHDDIQALQARLAALEEEAQQHRAERAAQQASRRRLASALTGLAVLSLGVGSWSLAASDTCPNAFPVCFMADMPARASQLNRDLTTIQDWIEAKVGPVTSSSVTSSNVTVSTALTANGSVSVPNGAVSFASRTAQHLNLYGTQYGHGVQSSTLYARSGGGFAWFRGGSHANNANDPGGGAALMTLDSAGNLFTAGTVNSGGYQTSCGAGSSGFGYGFCCRIDVRSGATTCRVAGTTSWTGFNAAGSPFAAGTGGPYSLTCQGHISGGSYPVCCRTAANGSVACAFSVTGAYASWQATDAPF